MFLRTGVAVLEAIRRMTKFNYVLFLINKQIPLGKELTKSKSFQIQTCTITIITANDQKITFVTSSARRLCKNVYGGSSKPYFFSSANTERS